MSYGTNSFTDRYGDFKQPTVIDYDQSTSKVVISPLSIEECLKQHEKDIELILNEILETDAFFGGNRYLAFTQATNGKLVWNSDKIKEMKSNSDWLFTLRKHLNKAKNKFISNKKL